MRPRELEKEAMKAKSYRISLAVAIIFMAIGLLSGGLAWLSAQSKILPPYDGYIVKALETASLSGDLYWSLGLGVAFLMESILIFIYRRKKRATMYLSFIIAAFIYVTLLAYFHITGGIDSPAWLLSRISRDRPWLLLVCTALEAILLCAVPRLLRPLDRRIYNRHELKLRKLMSQAESVDDKDEASPSDEEKQRLKDEKEGLRYSKAKEKAERKLQKKAEKEARKDEKRQQKLMEKEEEKARKAEEKAKRKEERHAADEDSETFTTSGAETYVHRVDPSEPVSFPDIASIPSFRTIDLVSDLEEEAESDAILPDPTPVAEEPPKQHDTVVFSQIKDEMERTGKEEKGSLRKSHDFTKPMSFNKGGMLEATLESLLSSSSAPPVEKGPIIGYDDKKKDKEKDRKPSSSIAPSGLSPDHPRYKLFEALAEKPNVSHFPSKGFVPEENPDEDLSGYGSVFVSEAKPRPEKRRVSPAETPVEEAPKPVRKKPEPVPEEVHEDEDDEAVASAVEVFEDKSEPVRKPQPIDPFSTPLKKKPQPQKEEASLLPEEEEREDITQENELLLSVGIGGLQSNELGFAGISKRSKKRYTAPSADFLVDYPEVSTTVDEYTREQGEIIVDTLRQFHTEVSLDNIVKGPTVTMYELKLKEGTPVSRVRSRYDEISYNLGGVSIRILAPVPGKQAVGIEVPNSKRAVIGFKDMLHAMKKDPDAKKLRVPMILGRTITGKPTIIDVAKMPHMLIAGTTGSGKSVCINTFVCTVLYTRAPQDVRFMMVDPKVVELSVYNGIPHLLTPVITDAKKVVRALAWLCDEMERRYKMLSKFGVRNIDGFNAKIINENIPAERMPYIVLIMDEFADLMTTVGKDIENYVARLAAKARAAGIHLVLATQRPSADVITGTIKNNFPARIAFAVSSATNSRIILDEGGAESLLGRGDMLFMNPSAMGFERIQGAFLSDEEVDSIASFEKRNCTPDYLAEDIFEEPEAASDGGGDDDADYSDEDSDEVLYERAKEIVYERKMASASFLQRRMKIGYNRAARLIEMMEDNGIIGPANGSKPREILKYE